MFCACRQCWCHVYISTIQIMLKVKLSWETISTITKVVELSDFFTDMWYHVCHFGPFGLANFMLNFLLVRTKSIYKRFDINNPPDPLWIAQGNIAVDRFKVMTSYLPSLFSSITPWIYFLIELWWLGVIIFYNVCWIFWRITFFFFFVVGHARVLHI